MNRTLFSYLHRVIQGRWFAWLAILGVLCVCSGCGASMARAEKVGAAAPPESPRGEESVSNDSVAAGSVAPVAPSPVTMAPPPSPASADKSSAQKMDFNSDGKGAPAPPPPPPDAVAKPQPAPRVAADVAPLTQMLIYAAELTMAVFEVDKCLARVETLAREMGGLLATRTDRQIVIRVPTAKFFEAVKQLEGIGDVLHKSVQVEDVSEEFRDLSLRLKNAREVRDRLVVLLAQAKTVEESIKVEREIERLSGEIQHMEGRLKYLKDRAAYSTITITFEPLQAEILQRQKVFKLPFPWLSEMGLGRLLNLH